MCLLLKNLANNAKYSIQLIFIMLMFIDVGFAIQCFICDSTINPGCTDLKKGSDIVPKTCRIFEMNEHTSWLSDLNRVAIHESSKELDVPMNCQKIVAKRHGEKPVTVRNCQINTKDTDACSIPRENLSRNKSIEIIHCSICNTDKCNGDKSLHHNTHCHYLISLLISLTFVISYLSKGIL